MNVKKLYYDIVQKSFGNADAFFTKVEQIAERLKINPSWLNDVMYIETAGSFNPAIKNPNSSATGLIQFMSATARSMGTSTELLSRMLNISQLNFVEKYLKDRINSTGLPKDGFEVYLLVFYPVWVGKPDSAIMSTTASNSNIFIDKKFGNRNNQVSKGEFRKFYLSHLPKTSVLEQLQKKSPLCSCCLSPLAFS